MTDLPTEPQLASSESAPAIEPAKAQRPVLPVQPVLEKLFELYPHLFGNEFLPLKLGIFQELLALHPEHFQRATLKAALGVHTRSSRYLQSVAAGKSRHDLQGRALEPVAPEHVCLAILELFRRKQGRTQEDLRPKFRARLSAAFAASGLTRQDYLARLQIKDAALNTLLEEALAEQGQKLAQQEALRRAFVSSGSSVAEFAEMYGLNPREVSRLLQPDQLPPG